MFAAVVYVTVCSGWLCKALHGDETRIEMRGQHKTMEKCKQEIGTAELAAKWAIGDDYPYRVVCEPVN